MRKILNHAARQIDMKQSLELRLPKRAQTETARGKNQTKPNQQKKEEMLKISLKPVTNSMVPKEKMKRMLL